MEDQRELHLKPDWEGFSLHPPFVFTESSSFTIAFQTKKELQGGSVVGYGDCQKMGGCPDVVWREPGESWEAGEGGTVMVLEWYGGENKEKCKVAIETKVQGVGEKVSEQDGGVLETDTGGVVYWQLSAAGLWGLWKKDFELSDMTIHRRDTCSKHVIVYPSK